MTTPFETVIDRFHKKYFFVFGMLTGCILGILFVIGLMYYLQIF